MRVLLRESAPTKDVERRALENLDSDHRFFAIPLFVADPKQIGYARCADFAIGLGPGGNVLRCFEFESNVGKVKEVRNEQRYALYDIFGRILHHYSLQTVQQFLGKGIMIADATKQKSFAENYDNTRKTSCLIIRKIRQHIDLIPKDCGLDIGCGTGNYTLPFILDYKTILGLDNSEEMLTVARRKGSQVRWIRANALATTLQDKSCDCIWSISTLHYFHGEQQKVFFGEVFRLLRSGGGMIVDTEFAEQHESLWLVEFFPSLRKRYAGRLQPRDQYKDWLTEIGFSSIEFDFAELGPDEEDNTLRIGQRRPELYLDEHILSGLPAFHEMDGRERLVGKRKLEEAISTRRINNIIDDYSKRATISGQIGLIIARRP